MCSLSLFRVMVNLRKLDGGISPTLFLQLHRPSSIFNTYYRAIYKNRSKGCGRNALLQPKFPVWCIYVETYLSYSSYCSVCWSTWRGLLFLAGIAHEVFIGILILRFCVGSCMSTMYVVTATFTYDKVHSELCASRWQDCAGLGGECRQDSGRLCPLYTYSGVPL